MAQGSTRSSHQPLRGNLAKERSNLAQNIATRPQFQSFMALRDYIFSSVGAQGLPSSRSDSYRNFGHQSRISSIRPQIASIESVASHQHHSSYQPLVSSSVTSSSRSHSSLCYEGSSGQESNSSLRPQNASIERCDKRKFNQESSSSSIRDKRHADLNVKRLKPLSDDRKFVQERSSSSMRP
ncbi:hypothetical protein JHK85_022312 [Glycine max]|nr:hypothetical protein JHK85_022312 [Glycine max]